MAANTKHRIQPKDRNSVATGPHREHRLATTTSQMGRLDGLVAVFPCALVLEGSWLPVWCAGMWGGHGGQRIWVPQIIRYFGSSIIYAMYNIQNIPLVLYVTGQQAR
jgi:hypothetical protein